MVSRFSKRIGFAAIAMLAISGTGCNGFSQLSIQNVTMDNPSLSVGDSSRVTIEATSGLGRTLRYTVRADRGRVVPETSTELKTLTYYAPFTSKTANSGGDFVTGDKLTIRVDDGYSVQTQTLAVNVGGTTIAYVQDADANGVGTIMLATTDENGLQATNLRPLQDNAKRTIKGAQPVVSPDGRQIAYVDYSTSQSSSALMTVDSSGRKQTIVPIGSSSGFNFDPTWGPSARELAFTSDRGGNFDIYRINTTGEGNTPTQITKTAINERFPAWNPSTQQDRVSTLVVSSQMNTLGETNGGNSQAAWNLFMLKIDSGQYLKQLTTLSDPRDYAFEAQWRHDGQAIAYTFYGPIMSQQQDSQRYQRVTIQDVTQSAGSGKIINRTETDPNLYESCPAWNQTGSQLAYLKSFQAPTSAALSQVWRQQVNGLVPSSDPPRQWTDFSAGVPAFWFQATQRRPMTGTSLGWH